MTVDWRTFDAALERYSGVFWLRDDDATEPTPALDRLLALAEAAEAPLTLAVIPSLATEALARRLDGVWKTSAAVHGWAHTNHAPADAKKSEFGPYRPVDVMAGEAARGLSRIGDLFGAQADPLFIPPWNRMDDALAAPLAAAGFRAVSRFAERGAIKGVLPRLDCHIDPIDWRGTRSLRPPQAIVDDTVSLMQGNAPIGVMLHHLAHDAAVWTFSELFTRKLRGRWVCAKAALESGVRFA